ncbi:hypothetical protein OG777_26760 [Micromonospora peucetia]|uniref:Uncharacterized protein n=1 Tax=Micromonospora peucetia TaxID=47871 RepID=A0A1C6W356_9ACTN|nr:hypothetical protein [Micromonospora peucetia]MCX4390503.1 hypothetical protein [Micromonospora peucetia]SCL73019.1 hypothetical protein GA0070608_5301 [Micromonospora peucetia]
MQDRHGLRRVGKRVSLPALLMLAVLVMVLSAARAVGLCIVFRCARAVPGCVPAWSADRAPPRLTFAV